MMAQIHSPLGRPQGHKAQQNRFGRLSWTPIAHQLKRTYIEPTQRYLHSAVVVKDQLYVLGGADNRGALESNRLFCFDTAALKWTTVDAPDYCAGRNGHVCAALKNQIYYFGGCVGSHSSNELFKFNPSHKLWTLLRPQLTVPAPRELPLFTAVEDSLLFLYGGIDIWSDTIYNDAFIFRNNSWHSLKINNNLSPRIKARIAHCAARLFLFGGEAPSEGLPLLFNGLHELVFNSVSLQITFKQVVSVGAKPPKRTSHGMAGLSEQYLIVFGGESCDSLGASVTLGDIWIFNVTELQWSEVQTLQGPMTPRFDFTFSVQDTQIYIFGGFKDRNAIVDQLIKLQYLPQKQVPFDICERCLSQFEAKEAKTQVSVVTQVAMSVGFLHNVALQIAFPFRAVQMIIDSAAMLDSNNILLSSIKSKGDFDVFAFEFDGETQVSDDIFINLTESHSDALSAAIVYQLKLGALRLGKTVLYMSADRRTRKVILFSVDSKLTPNFEEKHAHFSYIEDIDSGATMPGNGAANKQAIFNILNLHLQDPNIVLSRREKHFLMIFEVNILPTAEKAYYYELISYKQPENDIRLYCNERRTEFLEGLGLSLAHSPEFSLRSYLQIAKLNRRIEIFINSSEEQPIECVNYLDTLLNYSKACLIDEVDCQLHSPYIDKCALFRCRTDVLLEHNLGILIYCGNELFDRFKCPFGQLMTSKFYKKKFRTSDFACNVFEFVGIVYLSQDIGLNKSKSKVRKHFAYTKIMQELNIFLKSLKQNSGTTDHQLSTLYESRFSLNKQGGKRHKREIAQ